jgi:hypothetical protein
MKRLKTGVVNTLSFVKLSSFTVNSFDVTLDKVVGTGSLTITNLTDLNNLDSCKDFIQINIDLLSNDLEGGEYELTITNDGDSYKYLTEVQDYQYNTLSTGIYSDSVVISDKITSGGDNGGGSVNELFTVNLQGITDGNDYYVNNQFLIGASLENINPIVTDLTIFYTDSQGGTASKTISTNGLSSRSLLIDLSQESVALGDVGSFVFNGLNSSGTVLYTSDSYNSLVPPKVELYIAKTLSEANTQQSTNVYNDINIYKTNTSTYNLYAFVENNNSASILAGLKYINNDIISINSGGIESFNAISLANNTMTEVKSDILTSGFIADPYYSLYKRTETYLTSYTWPNGYETLKSPNTNIPIDESLIYETESQIIYTAYQEQNITIDNTIISLKGFSPIKFNALTSYIGDDLVLYIGDGTYILNANNVQLLAVKQTFTDASVVESVYNPSSDLFSAQINDPYDLRINVSSFNSNKTLQSNEIWIKYQNNWFFINNNSVNEPSFYLEV